MTHFLFRLNDFSLFILLSILAVVLSVLVMYLIRWLIPNEKRYADNAVLGSMSSFVSILYGVLAGLTALYLINNINDTTAVIQREANAITNLYRDSQWLKEPFASNLKSEIKTYLEKVINVEWPLMKQGKEIGHEADVYINAMSKDLSKYTISDNSQMLVVQEMLGEIKMLSNARESRIAASYSALNPEIWLVILLGSILTLFINYLFGMNFYLHLVTVCAAALMAVSMIFLILTLDKPFQGQYTIEADAFKDILKEISQDSQPPPSIVT